jgi:hypothetical protein
MRTLAPHLHLAVLGDDVVLLDTRADAYMSIPDGVAHLRPHPDGRHLAPSDEASSALETAGFLSGQGLESPARRPPPPSRSLDAESQAQPTPLEILRLGLAVADLIRRYRGRSLGEILTFVAQSQSGLNGGLPSAAGQDPERLAVIFYRLAPWLPIPRKCLVRSFVLLRFLQRCGAHADWVFGVSTWPFSAHCWIQSGDRVLDDHWERILVYEPIMVVG